MLIREIDANATDEIDLVAARMRATVVEVEGEENADRLHSREWIRERLLWHVTGTDVVAKVLVASISGHGIVGHTILQRETDTAGQAFGLFSTSYVAPEHRRQGIANALLEAGEAWFATLGLNAFATWTSSTNSKLIRLYERHGYRITESGPNDVTGTQMVRLSKTI